MLVIMGSGIASVGVAKVACGLVSDNSPQSQQALKDLPASPTETAGIIVSEATGNKNAKTIATGVDIVISAGTTNFKKLPQVISFIASLGVAVKDNVPSSDKSISNTKTNTEKNTNEKSTSSQQPNQKVKVPLKPPEIQIPTLIDMAK